MLPLLLSILLVFVGSLLMFVILLQRGKGGGLAGAFGGMGGQSVLGTKAGDVFTKITVGIAFVWIVLAGITGIVMYRHSGGLYEGGADAVPQTPTLSRDAGSESGEPAIPTADDEPAPQGAATDETTPAPATPGSESESPAANSSSTPESTTPESTTPESTTPESTTPDGASAPANASSESSPPAQDSPAQNP